MRKLALPVLGAILLCATSSIDPRMIWNKANPQYLLRDGCR